MILASGGFTTCCLSVKDLCLERGGGMTSESYTKVCTYLLTPLTENLFVYVLVEWNLNHFIYLLLYFCCWLMFHLVQAIMVRVSIVQILHFKAATLQ